MCGIFCTFVNSNQNINLSDIYETCKTHMRRRGPDLNATKELYLENYDFFFASSVLWLQGNRPQEQPIETENSLFVYNGDIFGGSLILEEVRHKQGDTFHLLKCLESSDDVLSTLLKAQGPYAFIYLDKRAKQLYFARDLYGRHSLIIGNNSVTTILASVFHKSDNFACMELPALGIFCFNLKSGILSLNPWPFKHSNFNSKLSEVETFLTKTVIINEQCISIPYKVFQAPMDSDLNCYKQLLATTAFQVLLENKEWLGKVVHLNKVLEDAVKRRIGTQPPHCQNCITEQVGCLHPLTGVLFSGGIDCAILALLAHKVTDINRPIDLLNVAFNSEAPDRVTGEETLQELKLLCPNRSWNFVEIDVAEEELEAERGRHIKHLIYPLNSVLDDSLGCALWFASRGSNQIYRSPCRVLLAGMGADELFGGYTKHRAALKRGGWSELNRLLEDDWQNISHRNLARDDRVVSDHGRQLRTPYLDENVVEYVRKLNCWERTYPSETLPQGLGEKILLRSLGYYLGLVNAAGFKKRALQFGTRIANKKENANDVSPRL